MSKVTNRKENYRSRSKNVCNTDQTLKSDSDIQVSRLNFKVDSKGYFVWPSSQKSKKI